MHKIQIRELKKEEIPVLDQMLYEAIFQEEGSPRLPFEIIKTPEIYVFIDNFGAKKDDYCLAADLGGEIIGAVWVRILDGSIKGYGYIDSETPEFAISLLKEHRGKGYGTLMMGEMIKYLQLKGYAKTSLSVDKNNYAVNMYKKLGFKIIKENQHDYIMLLKL